MARGAQKDEAWCLPLIATLGDGRLVPLFAERIEEWGSQKADKPLLALAARPAQALVYADCVVARDEVAALLEPCKRQGHKKVVSLVRAAVAECKRVANTW